MGGRKEGRERKEMRIKGRTSIIITEVISFIIHLWKIRKAGRQEGRK